MADHAIVVMERSVTSGGFLIGLRDGDYKTYRLRYALAEAGEAIAPKSVAVNVARAETVGDETGAIIGPQTRTPRVPNLMGTLATYHGEARTLHLGFGPTGEGGRFDWGGSWRIVNDKCVVLHEFELTAAGYNSLALLTFRWNPKTRQVLFYEDLLALEDRGAPITVKIWQYDRGTVQTSRLAVAELFKLNGKYELRDDLIAQ